MALTIGTQLGTHEITSLLGKGGMGEVYRARDLKLKREVAIKILPDEFSRDADRVSRFQREAEVLAALNHPNIAGIHELVVEGETLADRIAGGPIPVEDALPIAKSICDALEAAHEKGIIHRDLKPANIKLTKDGAVKVLDFGLARMLETEGAATNLSNSPTLMSAASSAGMIVGTAAYMSPEQARGKDVDKRADIWAFGVVLYEMITGERLFQGEDVVEILAAVVHGKPDLSSARIPLKVRRVLEHCLEKDPRRRLRDISGVALLLEDGGTEVASLPKDRLRTSSRVAWLAAALFALTTVAAVWFLWPATKPLLPLKRMDVDLGPNVSLGAPTGADVILSPDGSQILFVSGSSLFTLRLDQLRANAVELSDTRGATAPFFSPDGKWVGFISTALKKVSVDGGAAIPVAPVSGPRGAAWGPDGNFIASLNGNSGLVRVSEAGAPTVAVTKLSPGEVSHRWPQVLPGSQSVLFTVSGNSANFDVASIGVASLKDGTHKIVQRGGTYGRYVSASDGTGYLTFVSRGLLFAVPFDLQTLEVHGTPVPVLDDVGYSSSLGYALMDFSKDGSLVYRSSSGIENRVVQWLDASGKTESLLAKPDAYTYPRLSPDGQRLAIVATDGGSQDVWVYDVHGGRSSRLTVGVGTSLTPIWTHDGQHILYQGVGGMFWTRSDGGSQPQQLTQSKDIQFPWSFTPDGKRLAFIDVSPETGYDLWTVSIENDSGRLKAGTPEKFLVTRFDERHPSFSPDGRWIAYASNETGNFQIYVKAFPDTGGRWTISGSGGVYPVFSPKGRDLFYRTEDGLVMVASYTVKDNAFVADPPRLFSEKRLANLPLNGSYDVGSDGRIVGLFPLQEPLSGRTQNHVTFLLNFADEIRRRVGTGR
jgi:serine/threonine-protein kinase